LKKIAILNQKGGSGKTTTAVNLGAALSLHGQRILLVDMDPQGHLTQSLLGPESRNLKHGMFDLLKGDISFDDARAERPGISLIPSTPDLAAAETEITSSGKEFLLREVLKKTRIFDFCFMDCPPSLGLLTTMALSAADGILIPLQVEFLALHSLSRTLETLDLIKKRFNPKLEISGVVATRYDGRRRLNKEIMESAKSYFKEKLFQTIIRENISLAEGPGFGKTIFEYARRSRGSVDYMALAKEFLRKEGKK